MGDAVKSLTDNLELITDCCRYSEGILTEKQVRQKYHLFDESAWERLGSDELLIEKIELEKVRRIRSGAAKREKAQQLIVQAVDVLGGIALDSSANARHRIDASKALDTLADPGPTHAPASDSERYSIVINLGADLRLKVDSATGIVPNNGEIIDHDANTAPHLLAAIAANKRTDDGNGNPI
jgi:hypothetical protein